MKDWKFTNLSGLAKLGLSRVRAVDFDRASELLRICRRQRIAWCSSTGAMWPDCRLQGSHRPCGIMPAEVLELHLARHAEYRRDAFVAWNTSAFENGGFVFIGARKVVEEPVHFVHRRSGSRAVVRIPGILIVAGTRSQLPLSKLYPGTDSTLTNAVTEIVVGEEAIVDFTTRCRTNRGRRSTCATMQVKLGRDASFNSRVALVRRRAGADADHGGARPRAPNVR